MLRAQSSHKHKSRSNTPIPKETALFVIYYYFFRRFRCIVSFPMLFELKDKKNVESFYVVPYKNIQCTMAHSLSVITVNVNDNSSQ